MNLEIKKSKCKFYIDKEKRKVICVIPNTRFLAINFINDFNLDVLNQTTQISKILKMPISFSGVATCHEDDEFDEEVGKLIAYNRAKHKLNVSLFKRFNAYVNMLDREVDKIINACNAYGSTQEKNERAREEKIKKYFNEE